MSRSQLWRYVWRVGVALVLVAIGLPALPAEAQVIAPPSPPPVAPPVEPPVVAPSPVEVPTVPTAPAPDSPARWAYCNLTMAKWLDPSCGSSPGTPPADPGNPTDPTTSTVTSVDLSALTAYLGAHGGVMASSSASAPGTTIAPPWDSSGGHGLTGLMARIDLDASAPGNTYGLLGVVDPSGNPAYGIDFYEDPTTHQDTFRFHFGPTGTESEIRSQLPRWSGSNRFVVTIFIEQRSGYSTLYEFVETYAADGTSLGELVHYHDVAANWWGTGGSPPVFTWGSPLGLGPVVRQAVGSFTPSVAYGWAVNSNRGNIANLLQGLNVSTSTVTNPYAPPTVAPAPAPVTVPPTTAAPPAVDTTPTAAPAPSGVTDSTTTDTTLANRLLDGLHWLATELVNAIHWLADQLWAMFQWLVTQLWPMFQWLGSLIATGFSTLYSLLATLLGPVVSWLRAIWQLLDNFFVGFWTQLATLLQTLMTWLVTSILNGLVGLFVPTVTLQTLVQTATSGTNLRTYDPTVIAPPGFHHGPTSSLPTGVGAIGSGSTVCGPSFAIPAPISRTFYAPTPPESGCPGNGPGGARTYGDDQAGGVFGKRSVLRAFAAVLLWLAFVMRLARQMPWAAALEVSDGEMMMGAVAGADPRRLG